jgi:hypothetical protein
LAVESKIFAKFDLNVINQVALLNIDLVRFLTIVFSKERGRYTYNGSKRLSISDQDKQALLDSQTTSYQNLSIGEKRKHFERIHEKFEIPSGYPVIHLYDKESNNTLLLQPLSKYDHPYYTSKIHYAFNEVFINHHNRFKDGYRDVCVNVLDNLVSRYSRFFFIYLSGDKYEFRFSEEKLRKLLRIETKYRKRNAINAILHCVRNELQGVDINFDYSYCTEAEWEKHKERKDEPAGQLPTAENRKKNKKNKVFAKNFYFRAKGMEKYRIPKGVESIFSRDVVGNRQYGVVRTYLNRRLKMTDNYIGEKWEYIKQYVDEWGAQVFMDFADQKMKEMAKQKKKPRNPKSVLMSLIVNRVKDLDTKGRGQSTLFSIPKDTEHYNPAGKSIEEICRDYTARFGHPPPDTS